MYAKQARLVESPVQRFSVLVSGHGNHQIGTTSKRLFPAPLHTPASCQIRSGENKHLTCHFVIRKES